MKIYKKFMLSLLVLLLLIGCDDRDKSSEKQAQVPEKVIPVTVEIVEPHDLLETFTLPATLEARDDLLISAETAGTIKNIRVQEGDRVRAGEKLLDIDADRINSNLIRDQKNYQTLASKVKRYQDLAVEGLVSQQELEDLQNALTSAESSLRETRLQLDKCTPRAPLAGIVDRLDIDRGEYVDPGRVLLRLVRIDQLKAVTEIPEKDVPFLQVGQEVKIVPARILSGPGQALSGRIVHIAYSADDATRTYRTTIMIDNSSGKLRPGMIVRAVLVRQQLRQVISAPLYAVLDQDDEKFIFVAETNSARRLKIDIGVAVDQRVEIKSGLRAGQQLIIKGQQLLHDGARIEIQEN